VKPLNTVERKLSKTLAMKSATGKKITKKEAIQLAKLADRCQKNNLI